jgi:predicted Zn-dependent peptidase
MRTFHQSHYQPQNLTAVIVGDIPQDLALALVEQSFDGFAPSPGLPKLTIDAEPPILGVRRTHLELPRLELARLMLGWIGPGVDQLGDAYGLDLLSVLLAGGRTSRLVRELREERQLVQDIGSSFSLQRDSSLFTITAWLEPQYLAQVEALIGDRLSALGNSLIPIEELQRVQRQLCNDFAFSTETSSQLAGLYGYYSTIAQPEASITYPSRIANLQPETLQALANRYLSPYHYAAVVLTRA